MFPVILALLLLLGVAVPLFRGIIRDNTPRGGWLASWVRASRRGRRHERELLYKQWADEDDAIARLEVWLDRDLDDDGRIG
ncbi:MAG: hypothetical protein H6702_04190 [Myxococcales bacterium]|nr:hypothetical protein [Myxococcales bacterium]